MGLDDHGTVLSGRIIPVPASDEHVEVVVVVDDTDGARYAILHPPRVRREMRG